MQPIKCPECGLELTTNIKMSAHWRLKHFRTPEELYLLLHHNGVKPKCACGCGEDLKFHSLKYGFGTYRQGHATSIKNNWGHNVKALDKSHASRRSSFKNDKWSAWNKGLSKDSDDRVKAYGESQSNNMTKENKQNRSNKMKDQWENGNIVPLLGINHPKWSGGVSLLSARCHGHSKLYTEWKYPKLVAAGFRCSRCSSSDTLHVHHDKERMADIIRRFSEKHSYEGREDQQPIEHLIAEEVASYHVENSVSAIILCEKCHGTEHKTLNF